MFTSILTEISELQTILDKLVDLQENKDVQPDDTMYGVSRNGCFTNSQIRRFVDLENFIKDRVRNLNSELARFEREAPQCKTVAELEELVLGDTCTEAEAFEPAEDRSWWLVSEYGGDATETVGDVFEFDTDRDGVTTFRRGSSIGIW